MNSPRTPLEISLADEPGQGTPADVSPIAWVHDELRRSLDQAHKTLRRVLRETEALAGSDVDAIDPGVLRGARALLHQGAGALELVGLAEAATLLRASEAALQRCAAKPALLTAALVEPIERASFALLDYLGRLRVGKAVSPLSLFPQYRAVQEAAGAERVHPADLWRFDWEWRDIAGDYSATPRQPDADARSALEPLMLALMRQPGSAVFARVSDLCASLGAGAQDGPAATLWKLAGAVFEAQAQGRLVADVFSKRVASRLLAQLRVLERGEVDISERLAQDLLFFCAQAQPPAAGDEPAPRLAAARAAYQLPASAPVDYTAPLLGRFDPAWVAQARKRLAAAKESWSAVAGAELHRMSGLAEQFALVGDSLKRLFPSGEVLAGELQQAVAVAQHGDAAPPAALAMEVATSLLYVDACLEDGDFDDPALGVRVRRLAQRIGAVRDGFAAQPLEGWMEDLYRRVSDRQTMGSVVQELRASLADAETHIDHFFRHPHERGSLIEVPGQLASMRGVMSVLGIDQASAALLRMRDDVEGLLSTEVDQALVSKAGVFDRLAGNLGALGFLIDMLGVQPQMAKALFVFDAEAGTLDPVMGRDRRAALPAVVAPPRAAEPVLAVAAPAPVAPLPAAPVEAPPPAIPFAAPLAPPAPGEDAEMREVFLEEAREVLADARTSWQSLPAAEDPLEALLALRRAFHTLKGSARMVGLADFGAAGWACEQWYNERLAQPAAADEALLDFTGWVLDDLAAWVEDIAADRPSSHNAETVRQAILLAQQPLAAPAGMPPPLVVDAPVDDEQATALATQPLPLDDAPRSDEVPAVLPSLGFGPASPGARSVLFDLGASRPAPLQPVVEPAAEAAVAEPIPVESEELAEPIPVESEELAEPIPVGSVHSVYDENDLLPDEDENVKVIGPLRIGVALFNIFLNEADELSRRLGTGLAEWSLERDRPVPDSAVALAHSLAGNSATVGYAELSTLARALEHALARVHAIGSGSFDEATLFVDAADEIRRLLHQFAAGFLKDASPELLQRLHAHELSSARRLDAQSAASAEPEPQSVAVVDAPPTAPAPLPPATDFGGLIVREGELGFAELKPLAAFTLEPPLAALPSVRERADEPLPDDALDAVDAIDDELFAFFEEEGHELLPELAARLRAWGSHPHDRAHAAAAMRTLHTVKGGARLAGAMRLGELAHRLEGRIEHTAAQPMPAAADIEALQARSDALAQAFDTLCRREPAAPAAEAPVTPVNLAMAAEPPVAVAAQAEPAVADEPAVFAADDEPSDIDWSRFAGAEHGGPDPLQPIDAARGAALPQAAVRVRAPLLDRLVNESGEISIARSRIEAELKQFKGSLADLSENLDRLRGQLREIELQGETQMSSRLEAAKVASQSFDPLEFDRFTRFQELTRMMAESVNDVATVQRSLQRSLEGTEDALAAQARLARDLQDDLLRTRMVEFEGASDRLYRVVRQAAKETGKQVRLDIVGGSIEVDRGVLDRMTGAFEHLLRNSVTHGVELPAVRVAAGKPPAGQITLAVGHEGNEVSVEVRDDGAGLDLPRIRERGLALGLLDAGAPYTDGELANLIFNPGFSTADQVTELAGRGVGMDVVRAEVNAIGGRIETATRAGAGTAFKLVLPLTTAVTQVVMLRCAGLTVAVPSTLVELVLRVPAADADAALLRGTLDHDNHAVPLFWLGALLQATPCSTETDGRTRAVVVVRSAAQRVAVQVDEVLGNQEVVVKHLGPQLSRMPGLAGVTLLASGAIALIYNPVALATLYGGAARALTLAALQAGVPRPEDAALAAPAAPLVLVVDDSLTVRRVTQRLLLREGYRVALAKDGLDALERLAEEKPALVLSDIEMPRMDGFDLVRNIRGDARLRDLTVIMITSRIAQKHRDHALELGVDHYLGKPYGEEDLMALIGRYTALAATG